jgi:hypothetical protein
MGSRRAAQAYADLKSDPYQPVAKLFKRLVGAINRPVAVFIDDLDRCDGKYVVELLEGIQTLMRGAPVTYVVAADRKWICSSFEQHYRGFTPPIGEPGRPLGYLFLDKMFQISAAIPQLPGEVQSAYWANLLRATKSAKKVEEDLHNARQRAEQETETLTRQEDLEGYVDQARERAEQSGSAKDALALQAARTAAARRITSPEAARHTEHRLQPFSNLLESNPRVMKRLVNEYGMHQATMLLAGRKFSSGALARWTIMELRWPLLADFLAARPNLVGKLDHPLAEKAHPEVPESLRPLFGDELVARVIGTEKDLDRLDATALRLILGAVVADR